MSLQVHLLPPSPNNTKVMIALAYKGIDYDPILVDGRVPDGRTAIIEGTGQSLTPSIDHNGIKLFDSCAILRYVDANFEGPALFSADRDTHKAIESWENYHRFGIGPQLGGAFGMFFGGLDDADQIAAINIGIHEATAKIEEALAEDGGRDWLVGDHMTAADITIACFVAFACYTDEQAAMSPVWKWMQERFTLGEGRERTRAHTQRVLAFLPDLAALAG
jgi:glutathione S-transferase